MTDLDMNNNSSRDQSFVWTQSNDQTVLFLTIQFNRNHLFALSLNVKEFYLTLSGATTPSQSGLGNDGNEGVLCISQSSSITRSSPADCLEGLTPQQRCGWCILQPQPTGLPGKGMTLFIPPAMDSSSMKMDLALNNS